MPTCKSFLPNSLLPSFSWPEGGSDSLSRYNQKHSLILTVVMASGKGGRGKSYQDTEFVPSYLIFFHLKEQDYCYNNQFISTHVQYLLVHTFLDPVFSFSFELLLILEHGLPPYLFSPIQMIFFSMETFLIAWNRLVCFHYIKTR